MVPCRMLMSTLNSKLVGETGAHCTWINTVVIVSDHVHTLIINPLAKRVRNFIGVLAVFFFH